MNGTTRTFFIHEPDLALLERRIPILHEVCGNVPDAYMRADVQVAIEECKRILSDVRWAYGPHLSVEVAKS